MQFQLFSYESYKYLQKNYATEHQLMATSGMCLIKVLMAAEELVFFELRSCHILKNAPSYKSYRLVQESYALLSLMKSSFSFAINFLFPL